MKPKVEIVVPAYNESAHIKKNIELIYNTLNAKKQNFDWTIIIGENGSKDKTYEIAKNLAKKYKEVKAIHFDIGSKDNTIKSLWMKSKADIRIFTDADNSADPSHIPELVNAILNGNDIAIGSRSVNGSESSRTLYRRIISKIYNIILLPLILPTGVKDAQCGFKAINKEIAGKVVPKLSVHNGFLDTELLAIAYKKGYKIKEVPVKWQETRTSVLSVNKNIFNFLKNIFKTRMKIIKGYYE